MLISIHCHTITFKSELSLKREEQLEYSSLQGVGGIVELAPGYLPAAYKMVREAGGLCIADEVQAGVARTGSHFWGFEGQGVIPDIVTMAKVKNFSTALMLNDFTHSMIPH
jgi:4-aminobutyrate aminotransferase-like enzyme